MTARPQNKFFEFQEWLPDQASLYNPGLKEVNNVIPYARGYGPVPSVAVLSTSGGPTVPTGLFSFYSQSRNIHTFAGDATKLYKENTGTDTFDDVSRSVGGPYAGGTNLWRAVQFDDEVYFVNGIDDMQAFTLNVDTEFADAATDVAGIGGQYIAFVQDHLVLGRAKDDATGTVPNRVRWSGIRQPLSWAVDPQTRADFQDIQDFGEVRGVTGGAYMTVLMERGLVRGDLISGPGIFRFLDIEGALGCLAPSSVIRFLGKTYYLSEEGFRVFDGTSTENPGAERVDRTFFNQLKPTELDRIFPFVAIAEHLIGWVYVSSSSPDGDPDKAIALNYHTNKWTQFDAPFDVVNRVVTAGSDMDSLDSVYGTVDAMPGTLDSAIYQGGGSFVGGLKGGILRTLSGAPQPATIATQEQQVTPGARTMLNRAEPLVEGQMPTVVLDVCTRDRPDAIPAVATGYGYNNDGFIPLRNEARYHSIKAQISGNWSHATGIRAEGIPTGNR